MKIGVKIACLGAGWRRSGLSVGWSWFGERVSGMRQVEKDVGDSEFAENEGRWERNA